MIMSKVKGVFEPFSPERMHRVREQVKQNYESKIFMHDMEYLAKDKTPEELYELYVLMLFVDKGMDRKLINKQLDDIVALKERLKLEAVKDEGK
jgi:hypothetical protein